jgi:hypothetical protein
VFFFWYDRFFPLYDRMMFERERACACACWKEARGRAVVFCGADEAYGPSQSHIFAHLGPQDPTPYFLMVASHASWTLPSPRKLRKSRHEKFTCSTPPSTTVLPPCAEMTFSSRGMARSAMALDASGSGCHDSHSSSTSCGRDFLAGEKTREEEVL